MAKDVTLAGASYSAVPSIVVPATGGGTATFTDTSPTTATTADVLSGKVFFDANGVQQTGTGTGGGSLNPWVMRPDAEVVYTLAYDKHIVADEGVTFPAYTTTSQTLKASETISPTVPRTHADYNYYVAIRALSIPEYSVTTKAKGRLEYSFASAFYELVDYPTGTISALISDTKTTALSYSIFSAGNNVGLVYWSSGTAIARYASAAYGVAQTITAPTASGTAITIKTPAFITRGHTTYFTNTYMNAVTDVRYQYIIQVYRAPRENLSFDGWGLFNMSDHIMDCVHSSTRKLT